MPPSYRSSGRSDDYHIKSKKARETRRQRRPRTRSRAIVPVVCIGLLFCGVIAFVFACASPSSEKTATTSPEMTNTTAKESTVTPTRSDPIPLPLSGKIIILDAGHGGYDSGCAYPGKDPVYLEKDFNLKIAQQAKPLLEELGAEVYMTRTDDTFISIYARAALAHLFCLDYAKDQGIASISASLEETLRDELLDTIEVNSVDLSGGCMGPMVGSGFSEEMIKLLEFEYSIDNILFISIHNNWNSQTDMHGTLVYYVTDDSIIESEDRLIKNDPYYQNPDYTVREHYFGRPWQRDADLAQIMHDSITSAAPELVSSDSRQIVPDNFAVLREQGLPSVLLELTFVSNENDRKLLTSDPVIQKMAEGIADGCVNYFSSQEKKSP